MLLCLIDSEKRIGCRGDRCVVARTVARAAALDSFQFKKANSCQGAAASTRLLDEFVLDACFLALFALDHVAA